MKIEIFCDISLVSEVRLYKHSEVYMDKYKIDDIDRKILRKLVVNARRPLTEIARELNLSNATVHVRVKNLEQIGVIEQYRLKVNYAAMGYNASAFISLQMNKATEYSVVQNILEQIPEVTEIHYLTGRFRVFVKIRAKDTESLWNLLREIMHKFDDIQNLDSYLILNSTLDRPLIPDL